LKKSPTRHPDGGNPRLVTVSQDIYKKVNVLGNGDGYGDFFKSIV